MRKYLFIFLFSFLTNKATALSLELNSSDSQIWYKATKYGSIFVEGKLSSYSLDSLNGRLHVQDLNLASDLKGKIVLKFPRFKSDSSRRDDEVQKIILSNIVVTIIKVTSYQPDTGELEIEASIRLNGFEANCSAQLNQDTFLKEFSYSIGDISSLEV